MRAGGGVFGGCGACGVHSRFTRGATVIIWLRTPLKDGEGVAIVLHALALLEFRISHPPSGRHCICGRAQFSRPSAKYLFPFPSNVTLAVGWVNGGGGGGG